MPLRHVLLVLADEGGGRAALLRALLGGGLLCDLFLRDLLLLRLVFYLLSLMLLFLHQRLQR